MVENHEQFFKKRCHLLYFGHKDLNYAKLFFQQQYEVLESEHLTLSFFQKQNICKIVILGANGIECVKL